MSVDTDKSVRELALENPATTRVFEKLGIDYCCGGKRSLEEACRTANLNLDEVLASLEKAGEATPAAQSDWQAEPISALIAHIKETHHKFTREEIGRLGPLFAKVCSVHGNAHPELLRIRELFQELANELSSHLMKEEIILFPYLIGMEAALSRDESIARAPFGSVQNPISMMEHEHDSAGSALRAMREAANGYSAPNDACVSYQTLYTALAAFEADLHQHIHLENNVLFPRAVAMERGRSAQPSA
ncbi:MAG TPA: iron-sulfur cluster repair di-iron protein [Terriglobales bacterium]|nr:iron-sulfur cluster repair di-iron protein [Terriglobales bacterium]